MKKAIAALLNIFLFTSLLFGCGRETEASAKPTQTVNLAGGTWELMYENYNPQQLNLDLALSLPKFEGKSREEWYSYAESIGKVDNLALYWARGTSLSPDGDTAVYLSNKDCIDEGGQSIFSFELNTGEERILLKSENSDYYSYHCWLDDRTLLCSCDHYDGQGSKTQYLVCDLDGNVTPVSFQGENPYIYAVQGRFLAYQSDCVIYFGHFDNDDQWVETNKLETADGYPINAGAISPDGTLLAFPLRNPDPNNAARAINIWDISSGTRIPIPDPVIQDMENPAARGPLQGESDRFLEVVYNGEGTEGNTQQQLWRYVLPEEK